MATQAPQFLTSISSDGAVSPGQSHRSSTDFHFTVPDGTIDIQYVVTNSPNADTVTFNVIQDISAGADLTIAKNMKNGSYSTVTDYQPGGNFYIADPSNNPGNPPPAFTVEVYAVFPS